MKSSTVLAGLLPAALAQNTSCDQWASFSNEQYILSNDLWGQDAGEGWGCITNDGLTSTSAAFHADWNWSGGQSNVKAFPSVQRVIPLGRRISSISSMPTEATWDYTGSDIRADVAYDVFSSSVPTNPTWDGDFEIMLLGKFGDVGPLGSSQGTVTVAGRSWELFWGYNGAMQVYSFVAPTNINQFSGDFKNFFDFLSESKGVNFDDQYLLSYQFGSEPFTGDCSKFTTSHWSAEVV
ncbi:Endoglucanase-1 [Escovopsis weberi]|uniref:Endoglucanase-1 n=1 Tax=Escovopsis weberi TaxID=150374 RepID=A0A0M8MZD7_ESCWE|nr:Endoglucanase-1 [Escovopsis weberi]DAB41649.1 TPA_exp: endoglucanase-1 [Escovopsis weberi]